MQPKKQRFRLPMMLTHLHGRNGKHVIKQPDIGIEERRLANDITVYIVFTKLPFPRLEPAWYPLVVLPGQDSVDEKDVEAMLRHLWQFQLDIPSSKD